MAAVELRRLSSVDGTPRCSAFAAERDRRIARSLGGRADGRLLLSGGRRRIAAICHVAICHAGQEDAADPFPLLSCCWTCCACKRTFYLEVSSRGCTASAPGCVARAASRKGWGAKLTRRQEGPPQPYWGAPNVAETICALPALAAAIPLQALIQALFLLKESSTKAGAKTAGVIESRQHVHDEQEIMPCLCPASRRFGESGKRARARTPGVQSDGWQREGQLGR